MLPGRRTAIFYAICGLNECYHCMYAKKMWVNTYWLDKMGIDVPTTTDEFYDACKKFPGNQPYRHSGRRGEGRLACQI